MAPRARLKDIADSMGISTATVSMALSGRGKISAGLAKQVVAQAKKLGYQRSAGRTKPAEASFRYVTILHAEHTHFSWSFDRKLIWQLEMVLIGQGYYPLVIHMNPLWEAQTILSEIRTNRSGVVYSVGCTDEAIFSQLEADGIPVLIINNSHFRDRFPSVLADDIQGVYDGTLKLIDHGHTEIIYADFLRPQLPEVVVDRLLGFRKAMDEFELPFTERNRITVDPLDTNALIAKLSERLEMNPRPTAIFAHDDFLAACIVDGLAKLNISVPDEMSIIASGDVLDYDYPFLFPVSTMRIDIELLCTMAWNVTLSTLNHRQGSVQGIKTKLHYVDRGSIRSVPKHGPTDAPQARK